MRESRRPPPFVLKLRRQPTRLSAGFFFLLPLPSQTAAPGHTAGHTGAAAAVWVPWPLVWHCSLVRPSPALRAAGLGLTSCAAARRHFLFNVFMLTIAVCSTCRNSLVLSTLRCVAFSRAKQAVSGCEMAAFALPFVPFRLHARSLCRMGLAGCQFGCSISTKPGGAVKTAPACSALPAAFGLVLYGLAVGCGALARAAWRAAGNK